MHDERGVPKKVINEAAPFMNLTKGFIARREAPHEDGNRTLRSVVSGKRRAVRNTKNTRYNIPLVRHPGTLSNTRDVRKC